MRVSPLALFILFLTLSLCQYSSVDLSLGKGLKNHYNNHDDMASLRDVIGILEANKQQSNAETSDTQMENGALDANHGLVHAMHAAMHLEKKLENDGGMSNLLFIIISFSFSFLKLVELFLFKYFFCYFFQFFRPFS